jgi:hypothetical protein
MVGLKHPVADSMSLVFALYLPHSLHFFLMVVIKPTIRSTSQLFALKSVAKCHLTIELHVTHIDFLKSDFVLLVSVILTVCYNICWQYHNFTACILSWYEG